jgi:hypothetical protein
MEGQRPDGRRRSVAGGPLDGKPFAVTGYEVWCAWRKVRENKGAPGVDEVSVTAFEERLEDNLYKVWLCRVADYAERAVRGASPSSSGVQVPVRDSA